jgi:hypothetical protein
VERCILNEWACNEGACQQWQEKVQKWRQNATALRNQDFSLKTLAPENDVPRERDRSLK